MKLEDLRWYDWLFFVFVGLWLIPLIEIITHCGIMVIFACALWLFYFALIGIPYIPIYVVYKIYKWKKENQKGKMTEWS
ncbi:MAG: hypothetical protein QXQ64_02345 [Candidatus Bathyarchaeia archaeon]